ATSVTIPATVKINGKSYKVTAIEANAFKGNKKLKTVTIGKNITTIGKGAFSGCTALTTVKGGAKVNTIGANAFMNCKQLKKYIVTSKVSKIGAKAFYGCKSLKNIKINSKKLGKNSLGKKCFKSINKKAVIMVIKSKKKTYTSYINKSGIDKTTTVK
nr:leucine-rich repeat domain-containing protein [Eubacterium sp.]